MVPTQGLRMTVIGVQYDIGLVGPAGLGFSPQSSVQVRSQRSHHLATGQGT